MQNTTLQTLPTNAGVINVLDFGAVGDGVTDDTLAIQNAIKAYNRSNSNQAVVYLPVGTYLVSNSLKWITSEGLFFPYLTLQGESVNGTIIKLKNNCPGFTDPLVKRAVLITGSENPKPDGGGNECFRNNIYNLTVDTGTGNLGSIGIDYLANNKGSLKNVTIKGEGLVGLELSRSWPGPCYIKDLVINGFNVGVQALNHYQFCVTFEYLTLNNQKVAGIVVKQNVLIIKGLVSTNSVVGLQVTTSSGSITLIDSKFLGGSSTKTAIDNQGFIYIRNVTTTGYMAALKQKGVITGGVNLIEYSSNAFRTLFSNTSKSLKLPFSDAPQFSESSTLWANVLSYGVKADDNSDDTPEIQAALDSGKATIYFPPGVYNINKTLVVPSTVKRIIGMESFIKARATYSIPIPAIRFTSTINNVIVEGLNVKGIWQHEGNKGLALIDCGYGDYKALPGAGRLWCENVMIGNWEFVSSQSVWMRQLNTEFTNSTRVINNGATLWILGIKTEDGYTVIETNSGKTELIGGLLYPGHGRQVPTGDVAFRNNDSSVSLIYTVAADNDGEDYTIHCITSKLGTSRSLLKPNLSSRGPGSVCYYVD